MINLKGKDIRKGYFLQWFHRYLIKSF